MGLTEQPRQPCINITRQYRPRPPSLSSQTGPSRGEQVGHLVRVPSPLGQTSGQGTPSPHPGRTRTGCTLPLPGQDLDRMCPPSPPPEQNHNTRENITFPRATYVVGKNVATVWQDDVETAAKIFTTLHCCVYVYMYLKHLPSSFNV